MPFPFTLPTTSRLAFQAHLTSSTHPSLPSEATSKRNVLYAALKSHKRLPDSAQVNNFQSVRNVLNDYLPYVLTIEAGLSGKTAAGEEVDIALTKEIEVEWRTTLSASNVPGRDLAKVRGKGLDYEVYCVLQTLASLNTLVARQAGLELYSSTTPSPDSRLTIVQSVTRSLTLAHSVHAYVRTLASGVDGQPSFPPTAVDISVAAQSALAELSHAEVILCYVLKDDPYPAILIQSRNKDDKEWMVKAPEIPKLRAQVLARLCLSASERAATSFATLKTDSGRFSRDLISYCEDLRNTCKAKGCRFLAIDADLGGETGKAIAWLRGGLSVAGVEAVNDGSRGGGLGKLRSAWNEKREDKKIEKGTGKWGVDGGKAEEGRILQWLEQRMSKMNDTVNVQIVPEYKPLLSNMPSGRDIPMTQSWTPPVLTEDILTRMRAPPEHDGQADDSDSSREGDHADARRLGNPVGAFPGTQEEYSQRGNTRSYF